MPHKFITIITQIFHNYAWVNFQFQHNYSQHNYIFQQREFHSDTYSKGHSAGPQVAEPTSTPNFDSCHPAMHTNPYYFIYLFIISLDPIITSNTKPPQ
jgi:hypothetical protein